MSGMKFRLQCAKCQDTFFSPDRRGRFCPKCSKTQAAKPPAPANAHSPEPGQRKSVFERFSIAPKGEKPKSTEERQSKEKKRPQQPKQIDVLTPELRERAIEMYAGYVDRGERPPDGRRRTIARTLGVTFGRVKEAVHEWAKSQYEQSLTPERLRENTFAIEKAYWAELDHPRYSLSELPDKIAAQLKVLSSYQVKHWIEMIHDEPRRAVDTPDVEPQVASRIIEAYQAYLAAPAPPEQGLHATIAQQIGGITPRQVHKTLLNYRRKRRAEYPHQ